MYADIGGKSGVDLVGDTKALNPLLDLILTAHQACRIETVEALKIHMFIAQARGNRPRAHRGFGGSKA